jgi:putative sporulation protein YyaC
MHPNSISIAIDAAVGDSEDTGLIRVINKGLKPGLGVNKNLGTVGDISIIGVVSGKSNKNYDLFNLTRLNLVYRMAENIVGGIEKYVAYLENSTDFSLRHHQGA